MVKNSTDTARVDRIVDKIHRIWSTAPHLRFSQIVSTAYSLAGNLSTRDISYNSDEELEDGLDIMLQKLSQPKS